MRKNILWVIYSVVIALVILVITIIIRASYNYQDVFDKYMMQISFYQDNMIISSDKLEVQKEDSYVYYIDKNNDLHCRKEDDEIMIKGVCNFLIDNRGIYYQYISEKKRGIYFREKGTSNEKKVLDQDANMFAVGADVNIVYTWKDVVCTYDKHWNKLKELDIREQYGNITFCDALYEDNHIVFRAFNRGIYVYSIEENKIITLDIPISESEDRILTDMIKTEKGIFYMICLYNHSDLVTSLDKINCKKNGIYQINVRTGTFEKRSDDCGLRLWCLNDELYVEVQWHWWQWISLRKCEMI